MAVMLPNAYDPAAGASTDRSNQHYLSHLRGGGAAAWAKTDQRELLDHCRRDGTGHPSTKQLHPTQPRLTGVVMLGELLFFLPPRHARCAFL